MNIRCAVKKWRWRCSPPSLDDRTIAQRSRQTRPIQQLGTREGTIRRLAGLSTTALPATSAGTESDTGHG